MKTLLEQIIMKSLNESFGDKSDLHSVVKNISKNDHDEMHDHDTSFDDKFGGNSDKVADLHKHLSGVHAIKHLIAKHVGDIKGSVLHKKAAKLHDIAHKQINGGYHEDSKSELSKAQSRHENATKASIAANTHDY